MSDEPPDGAEYASIRALLQAETEPEVGERTVDAATALLSLSHVAVFVYDETDGRLHPIAHSDDFAAAREELPSMPSGDGVVGEAFSDGAVAVVDDVRSSACAEGSTAGIVDYLAIPLGGYGIVFGGRTSPGAFSTEDRALAELLGAAAEAAFERVMLAEERGEYRQLAEQIEDQFDWLQTVNERRRSILRVAMSGESRGDVERAACEELVDVDSIAFAWAGVRDPSEGRLRPRQWSGADRGYLESVSLSLDASREPAVCAVETGDATTVSNAASELQAGAWRREALRREFRSAIAIPLVYQGVTLGVLAVYSNEANAFDGLPRSVLTDVGEAVAYTIAAVERKQALLTDRTTEVDFRIDDPACVLLRLAEQTGCSLDFDGLVPRSDGSAAVFVRVTAGSVDDLLEYADDSPAVSSVEVLQEGDSGPLVQVRFTDSFIASLLANHGIQLREIGTDDGSVHVTVAVPPTIPVHYVVDVMATEYPDSTFLAKRESASPDEVANLPRRLLDGLTDRQREAIRTAYAEGYFDSPKGATGSEVAESMGLSSSAFNEHLRAAQRTMFDVVFGE